MDTPTSRCFRAHMDDLQAALALAEEFCKRHGVASADALRLVLVLEELFTNTVMHGHRGNSDAPVLVGLQAAETQLHLHYADNAAPFDPRQYLQTASQDPDVDRARLGGHGLWLVAEMAERLEHAHDGGYNRLTLVLRRS
jgi:anti-sigma regulatory factor (Ser/Thr protein kinase)